MGKRSGGGFNRRCLGAHWGTGTRLRRPALPSAPPTRAVTEPASSGFLVGHQTVTYFILVSWRHIFLVFCLRKWKYAGGISGAYWNEMIIKRKSPPVINWLSYNWNCFSFFNEMTVLLERVIDKLLFRNLADIFPEMSKVSLTSRKTIMCCQR